MQPGHPFLTEELDQLRRDQRRFLRLVPDWVLAPDNFGPQGQLVEGIADDDKAFTEWRLRSAADALIDEQGESIKRVLNADLERLAHFMAHETALEPGRNLRRARADLVEGAARVSDQRYINALSDEERKWLPQVILMLAWADELASDYCDPRIARSG